MNKNIIKKCIYFSIAWIFFGTISTTLLKVYILKENLNILLDLNIQIMIMICFFTYLFFFLKFLNFKLIEKDK